MASFFASLPFITSKGVGTDAIDISFSRRTRNWTVFLIRHDRSYVRLCSKIFLPYLDLNDCGNPLTTQRGDETTSGDNLIGIAYEKPFYLLSPMNEDQTDIETRKSTPQGIHIEDDIYLIHRH